MFVADVSIVNIYKFKGVISVGEQQAKTVIEQALG
jgi:hypothetical protein